MTQEEIEHLKTSAEAMAWMETLCDDVRDASRQYAGALDRLAILEAAIAWHGFDEVPEKDSYIDFSHVNGRVYRGSFRKRDLLFIYAGFYTAKALMEEGFTGWRYPVGDLG